MKRNRTLTAAALCVAAVALAIAGTVPAAAGVTPGGTAVEIQNNYEDTGSGFSVLSGRVFAQPQACAKNRRVNLLVNLLVTSSSGGYELVDSSRTSERGYFGLGVSGGLRSQNRVVAVRSKIKVRGETLVCRRASDDFNIFR